ncbi:MAG TPA: TonB-dependent receptor [Prolixibacteraceae bacterium]|nr:TonB-dependent receptor [Prolixibacteraceae bacterium]
MKQTIAAILILFIFFPAVAQQKKRGKVKRKYRNVEQVNQTQPAVYFRGIVRDAEKNPLPGAAVTVQGTRIGAHTNADGEFFLTSIPTGRNRFEISFLGYKTKTIDYVTAAGQNFHNITLDKANIHLGPITVTSQKRQQQLLDVPLAITSIDAEFIEENNITELNRLSEFIPGLYIREQGANRPSFVIRGLTSDEVSPSAQPRVSVFFNNVPVSRASGAALELFDMKQVEVLKGPQNTLFGRGAQAGAIHFISKKPVNDFEGFVTAGIGEFNKKEFRGMVNLPVIDNLLFVRAAGIYKARDGYVDNTFGGTLNGENTIGGRFSARFLPSINHKFDLVVNYQKDDTPGIAFMSKQFPNTLGETDIFNYNASLEQGENLGTGKEILSTALTYKYFRNELNYWTSITSFRTTSSFARWDGDGTAAAAIDMSEDAGSQQFYQEIRYNFSRNSRLNGSGGASYWREKADQTYWFSPNEQNMFHLFFDPTYLITAEGQPVPVPALPNLPQLGPLGGAPLPQNHEEESYSDAKNSAIEAFMDGTYQLTRKLFAVGGIRAIYEKFELSNRAEFTDGSPSTLGNLTGNAPNLFFRPSGLKTIDKTALSFTWRAGLKYRINDKANIFANYSRGRRPNVLQFTSIGEEEILDAEKLTNYDLGFKASVVNRVFIDAVGFYQKYTDFQTRAWVADTETGEFNYKVKDGGQATSYGAEASLRVAVLDGLDVFGNYAWLHSRFDSIDVDNLEQEYAGNSFRLSPEHSFALGFNAKVNVTPNILFFITPSYAYKTHIYFEDANTEGLEQPGYGLLNVNTGLELADPNIILSVYGTNLLNEEFITSAGNTGSLFGVPTFVPGPPRMLGAKLTWKF